jgi:hypothetical protein
MIHKKASFVPSKRHEKGSVEKCTFLLFISTCSNQQKPDEEDEEFSITRMNISRQNNTN